MLFGPLAFYDENSISGYKMNGNRPLSCPDRRVAVPPGAVGGGNHAEVAMCLW